MHEITHRTETRTETVIVETDDGNGNILEEETQETITTLYITVSHKTADEMSAQYGFNADQKQQLAELLAQDSGMWAAVLYGIYGVDDQIVAVALSQVGNVGIGHGTASAAVWSGAPVSSAGAQTNAAISTPVSFRSSQVVSTVSNGSGSVGSGRITPWSPRPA